MVSEGCPGLGWDIDGSAGSYKQYVVSPENYTTVSLYAAWSEPS
jgi:hypothetical protein